MAERENNCMYTKLINMVYEAVEYSTFETCKEDLHRANAYNKFYNDNIIEMYMHLLSMQYTAPNVHFFGTHFTDKVLKPPKDTPWERRAQFMRKAEILEKKIVIIPIHDEDEKHWLLVVVVSHNNTYTLFFWIL
mmetsp:Transcript_14087/g.25152  ORF Transcript_14087/g.25152 Transcript_14087/m.25152 type:complete len:134 (+) Transcript_14087:245-646(+)